MKNKKIKIMSGGLFLATALLFNFAAFGQAVEMADEMRANGKIYVVTAVMAIMFFGVLIYLARLDQKISNMEKDKKQQRKDSGS